MTELTVKGRGRLTAMAQTYPGGVVIRLDDDRDLAWWAEINLRVEELRALVWEIEAGEENE